MFFLIIPFYFLHTHTCMGLHITPQFSVSACFLLYLSHFLINRFQYNLYYYLPYACSTSTAIFRLIVSFKFILEHTLHSRVKDSIAHISIVIVHQILRENCYINVNCDTIILWKTIILVMSYAECFKVSFNGLDLFILSMHILTVY